MIRRCRWYILQNGDFALSQKASCLGSRIIMEKRFQFFIIPVRKKAMRVCVFTVEKPSSAKNNSRHTVNRQPNVTIADPTAGDLSPEKASQSIDYTAAHQGQSFEVNESESITPTSPRAKQSRTIEHLPEKVGRYRIYGQLGSGGSGLVLTRHTMNRWEGMSPSRQR